MKTADKKKDFIRMRAELMSHTAIAAELKISRSTCSAWEKELHEQIGEVKRQELAELCESYGMSKEARIKGLGKILGKIDEALSEVDFKGVDPVKLLDYKLKYTEALKAEYIGVAPAIQSDNVTANSIMGAVGDLLNRIRAGEVPAEQAQKEGACLMQLMKAYDTVEVKNRIDELDKMVNFQDSSLNWKVG